jgi:hypothetical protein
MYTKMRTAKIIRKFATGTRTGTAISIHSVRRLSSFRTLISQDWRSFHGFEVANSSGSLSHERSYRLQSTSSVVTKSRHFHSSSILEEQKANLKQSTKTGTKPDQNAKSLAISINKQIVALGKGGQWREILTLYQAQEKNFNAVNYTTVMSQLARIHQVQQDDPLFEIFLFHLNAKIVEFGLDWLGKDARSLSTIVYAVAKMKLLPQHNSTAKQIMTFLGDKRTAKWLMEHGNPQDIAHCIWACGTLGIEAPNLFQLLDKRAPWLMEHGNPQDIANCTWACGTLGIDAPNLFQLLDDRAEWLMENGTAQSVANCVWACGTLGIKAPNLFQLLDNRAQWLMENGSPQEVANCIWACGTLGIDAPNLFRLLDDRAEWLMENGTAQSVSNCVWVCGALGIEAPKLFQLLDHRAEWLMENGTPQSVSNCAWACGTLGIEAPNLFKLLDRRADWLMENGSPQVVANCVWACGTLGIEAPNLFQLLDHGAEWLIKNGTPQTLSNCVWACGTLGIKAPKLFQLLDNRAEWLMEKGSPQGIANCVWACGTLGIEAPNLLNLLDQRAEWLMKNGSPHVVANCVWACGTLGIEAPNLLQLLDHQAEWFIAKGSPQDVANCAWALAVLGIDSLGFFSAFKRHLNNFLVDADSQQLCNACYAVTVLDESNSNQRELIRMLFSSLLDRKLDDLPGEALAQILYVQTFASAYGIELSSPPSDLQSQLDQMTFKATSSRFEAMVSNTLLDMGFSHQREFSPLKSIPGLLSVDIACPDRMVAVECDGPSHYRSKLGDEKRRENGPTKAKRRLLQHLGWNVINLNWAEAHQNQTSKEWLLAKLSEASVEL